MTGGVPGEPGIPGLSRLVVLLSGRGSNFVALAEACRRGELPAEIVGVISDRADAGGLERAREFGIPTHAIERRGLPSRAVHGQMVRDAVARLRPDLICLAGYMRILPAEFIDAFPMKIVNIHPSLLPSFPGIHAQKQALEYGVGVSGCTVHFVDAGLDSGPIILQRAVEVRNGDDESTLSARILEQEHLAYGEAVGKILRGGWWIEGRRVRFPDDSRPESPVRGIDALPGGI